jgi:Domain of unknown function.
MNKRKLIAAILTVLMVTTMTAPAAYADTTSGSTTGAGASEGNPASDIFRVVLPTTAANTYDFIMDPNNLLSTSSLNGDRTTYDGSSVYFTSTTGATVKATNNDPLYIPGKVVVPDLATVTGALTVSGSAITAVADNTLYVWVPTTGSEAQGLGEWLELDNSNITNYFDFTYSDATTISGYTYKATLACDGNLYYAHGVVATPEEAAAECTITSGAISAIGNLYSDAALTTKAVIGDLTYVAPKTVHTKAPATQTATNKSTFGVILNVAASVTNTTTPVKFTKTSDIAADTGLNFAIDILGDDKSVVANVTKNSADENGAASVDFYVPGVNTNYSMYQGAADANTGGHTYNYLEKTDAAWSNVDFNVQASCNTTADWTTYNNSLTAGNRLGIGLTFTMSTATVTATPGDNYNATTGVITINSGSAPAIATTSYTIAKDAAKDVTVDLGSGTLGATGVASIKDGGTTVNASNYSLTGSTLTLSSAYINTVIGAGTSDVSKSLDVTFNDGASTKVTITLNYTVPNVAASVLTATGTYSKASGTNASGDVVINYSLGSGTLAKTAVTTVYVEGPTGNFNMTSQYPTYIAVDPVAHTIKIKSTWLTGYTAGQTVKIFVSFDSAPKGSTADTAISITN